jgi:hypothetical protein
MNSEIIATQTNRFRYTPVDADFGCGKRVIFGMAVHPGNI